MKVLLLVVAAGISGCGAIRANQETGNARVPLTQGSPKSEVYKTVGSTKLTLNIYEGESTGENKLRPAMLFFFGGGWSSGSPTQFEYQSRYLASRGMVAITVDYRVRSRHNAQVKDCVADARSAVRWVRANAERLGVDPDRIGAAGGSAGGHLAASTAFINEFDEPSEDKTISAVPNALVLFNPALVLAPVEGEDFSDFGAVPNQAFLGAEASRLSPAHHISPDAPPTLIFHGQADQTVPFATAQMFSERMKAQGNSCTLVGYPGQAHGFFNGEPWRTRTLIGADEFLQSLGWLEGKPTLTDRE